MILACKRKKKSKKRSVKMWQDFLRFTLVLGGIDLSLQVAIGLIQLKKRKKVLMKHLNNILSVN